MAVVVYRITCIPTGKQYIGITQQSLRQRWHGHCGAKSGTAISNAIQKYGRSAFTIEILYEAEDRLEANIIEETFIAEYGTRYPNGYNIAVGGDNAATREKGFHLTEDHKTKISAANKGKKRSPEFCSHMSSVLTGRTLAPAHAARVRVGGYKNRGKVHSEAAVIRNRLAKLSNNKGVRFEDGKWRACIMLNGKKLHLGSFATMDEARVVRDCARDQAIAELKARLLVIDQQQLTGIAGMIAPDNSV